MGHTAATHPPTPAQKTTPGASFFLPHTSPSSGTALGEEFNDVENLPLLFTPITAGSMSFKNRIFVAPMCQYSSDNGKATPWHMVHLGTMAVRGAALVIQEATSVLPNGRISPEDMGLWNDEQRDALKPIFDFIKSNGCRAGIQLSHAGRKASTLAPWLNMNLVNANVDTHIATEGEAHGWTDVWAPSPIPYIEDKFPDPVEMGDREIEEFKQAWKKAVVRAEEAGVCIIMVHAAHGYLLHEYLSPLSNKRTDKYGGSLENRMRLLLEIIKITRETLSKDKEVFVRISATDNHVKGEKDESSGEYISWGIEQSKILLREMIKLGVTMLDVSTSGIDSNQSIKVGPGYQVPFAEALRQSMDEDNRIPISAVGLITDGKQAEEILQKGQADVITVAREFLRHADLVTDWAHDLGVAVNVPVQYQRAHTRMLVKKNKKQ